MNERMSERTNKQTNERKEGINSLLPKAKTEYQLPNNSYSQNKKRSN